MSHFPKSKYQYMQEKSRISIYFEKHLFFILYIGYTECCFFTISQEFRNMKSDIKISFVVFFSSIQLFFIFKNKKITFNDGYICYLCIFVPYLTKNKTILKELILSSTKYRKKSHNEKISPVSICKKLI